MNWNSSSRPALLLSCAAALMLSASAMADQDKKTKSYGDETKAESSEKESGKFTDRMREGARDAAEATGEAAVVSAVKTRLMMNEHTKARDIKVEADGDVVTLSGDVESEDERELAEMIAANTHGVEEVDNRLRIDGDRY